MNTKTFTDSLGTFAWLNDSLKELLVEYATEMSAEQRETVIAICQEADAQYTAELQPILEELTAIDRSAKKSIRGLEEEVDHSKEIENLPDFS